MRRQRRVVADSEQFVKQSRVPKVDFWRLDLALSDIFKPGRQLANHEGTGQPIKVLAHGGLGYTKGPRGIGCIPSMAIP